MSGATVLPARFFVHRLGLPGLLGCALLAPLPVAAGWVPATPASIEPAAEPNRVAGWAEWPELRLPEAGRPAAADRWQASRTIALEPRPPGVSSGAPGPAALPLEPLPGLPAGGAAGRVGPGAAGLLGLGMLALALVLRRRAQRGDSKNT